MFARNTHRLRLIAVDAGQLTLPAAARDGWHMGCILFRHVSVAFESGSSDMQQIRKLSDMQQIRKLRIAVIANANLPVPPHRGNGGTQREIFDLITELDRRGHAVTLYAPLSSHVAHLGRVTLQGLIKQGLWEPGNRYSPGDRRELEVVNTDFIVRHVVGQEHDVINVRSDDPVLLSRLLALGVGARIVYSLHNVRTMATLEPINRQEIRCVAHCQSHRRQYGDLKNVQVILDGIDTREYPFSAHSLVASNEVPTLPLLRALRAQGRDYLISLSAIRREKGQQTAIELARRAGMPLIIAGTPEWRSTNESVHYFEHQVRPAVDDRTVFYYGNANEEVKKELLRFARGFVFPSGYEDSRWEEPFGRAPVEALACGTPVLAFAHGSLPEIIEPGVNGFLFRTVDEAVAQLRRLAELDRAMVRMTAVTRFDRGRVADEYEALFYGLREAGRPCRSRAPTRPASDCVGRPFRQTRGNVGSRAGCSGWHGTAPGA